MTPCPTENTLLQFIEGALPAARAAAVLSHTDECPVCRALLMEVARPPAGLSQTEPGPRPLQPEAWAPPAQIEEYRLLRPLGHGAMGQVYIAEDTRLDRTVAIKLIAAPEPDQAARDRFFIEARAIARLTHPNVVGVYRVGEVQDRPYLVSEHVRGQSLDQLKLPLPGGRVLAIALGLSRGLAAAHRRGVLHRDIKPANAILAEDGDVKLLDFGLAKLLDTLPEAADAQAREATAPAPADAGMTRTGAILGTPRYMAPESWRGEPATRQADLYSLGALLYELATGHPPHRAPSRPELYRQVQDADAAPLCEVAPSIDTRLGDVVDRCLRRDPAARFASAEELLLALERLLDRGRTAAPLAGNPYRGLHPFEAEHRALFFGRSAEASAVVEMLRSEPAVLVAGDSGVGKSSLCRAGVLCRVEEGALGEEGGWRAVSLMPGRRPLRALADALGRAIEEDADALLDALRREPAEVTRLLRRRKAGIGLVLFLDQMEELLTQSDDEEAAQLGRVLGHLYERLPGVRVLMTARADLLARLAELPGVGPLLTRALYLLRSLSAEGLREAITGPAGAHGVRFESEELVRELMESTGQTESGLPLLQFALSELWAARDAAGQLIPEAALRAIGGVEGALSRHADGVLKGLLPGQQQGARRILTRLVTVQGLRVRRGEHELPTDAGADRVALEALVRGRLLVAREGESGAAVYEVAHEALAQGWSTLHGWLTADLEVRALRERIEAAAAEWERLGRAPGALWSEPQLREVAVLSPDPAELHGGARAFLSASRRQVTRRRRTRGGVVAALLCLPLVLLLFVQQWRRTREQRQLAEAARLTEAMRASHLAQLPGKEIPALVSAIQAAAPSLRGHRVPAPPVQEGLSAAVTVARRSIRLTGHLSQVLSAAISSDGQRIVTSGDSGEDRPRLWDRGTGRPLATLAGHTAGVRSIGFSSDGAQIVTSSEDRTARIWDGRTGQLRLTLAHPGRVCTAAFSSEGGLVLTGSVDGQARLWDARTGQLQRSLPHGGTPASACRTPVGAYFPGVAFFAPDGQRVITTNGDDQARLWDSRTGQLLTTITSGDGYLRGISLSPDGEWAATVAEKSLDVSLWSARTGRPHARLSGHTEEPVFVRYSPDGRYLISGGKDPSPRLWDGRTGARHAVLRGHVLPVRSATFAPDGRSVVTASADNTLRAWDTADGRALFQLEGHADGAHGAVFCPDGTCIVSTSEERTPRLWHLDAGLHLLSLKGHSGVVLSAALSGDGLHAVTGSADRTARVWDRATGGPLAVLSGHSALIARVAISPDGRLVATASGDGTVQIWDWRARQRLATLTRPGEPAGVYSVAFSPDGRRLVTDYWGRSTQTWDWRAGAVLATWPRHENPHLSVSAFSPDGGRVATGEREGTVWLWDAQTGRPLAHLAPAAPPPQSGGDYSFVAFSPDGTRLASREGTIWDVPTKTPLARLTGHLADIASVRFSPDGDRVVSTGGDDTVRIWAARTGQQLMGFRHAANDAAFSPDGQRVIVSPYREPTAFVFPATTEEVFQMACQLLRYQPELAQVQKDCPPFLPAHPGPM